jgi:hypothetical protein
MRWVQVIACLFVVFGPTSGVNAAPLAGVERLQSPAWLIRDDVRVPLALVLNCARATASKRVRRGMLLCA